MATSIHPLLQGRLRPFLYSAAWLGMAVLLAALFMLYQPRPLAHALWFILPMTLLYANVCLSAWWVCRAHPLRGTPPARLAGDLAGATLQAAAVWVAASALWGLFLSARFGMGPDRAGLLRDLALLFGVGVVLYGQSLALHYFLLTLENARRAEQRLLASQVGAREAELKALRAQLHPHFLFNSLNSISALVGPDPEAARRMCGLLGDFLRASLALGARERVAFEEELSLAERYLAIEQVRFGDRLAVERAIEPAALPCLVPPLLIQPLIENAVKHGVADRVEGGTVRIEARRDGARLEIAVENPRDPDAPPRRGHGLGLENVRRRLETLDPRLTRVDVLEHPDRFRVALALPAVENGPAPGPGPSPAGSDPLPARPDDGERHDR